MPQTKPVQSQMTPEELVTAYIDGRRLKIQEFCDEHFSLNVTFETQKRFFVHDFLRNTVNALWAIPYVSVKKVAEGFDKIGFERAYKILSLIPSGLNTRYQREVEWLVRTRFLQVPCRQGDRHFVRDALGEKLPGLEDKIHEVFDQELKSFGARKAAAVDLTGSIATLLFGWGVFGDWSLGITEMGQRLASKLAHKRAVSSFFLGKGAGEVFYGIFPTAPTKGEIFLGTLALVAVFSLFSVAANILCDPAQTRMGVQQRRLDQFLTSLEARLLVVVRRSRPKT